MFFGKQKVNRDGGRGLCYQGRYRGLFKGIAGAALACLATVPGFANAAAVLTFTETDNGVVATLSGTIDLNGAEGTEDGNFVTGGGFNAAIGLVRNYGDGDDELGNPTQYEVTGPSSFDNGAFSSFGATSVEADSTQFLLYGKEGYISFRAGFTGGEVSGSMTFAANDTFSEFGLLPGTYTYTIVGSGDTFTVQIGEVSPVPLPASVLFLGAGIGGFGLVGRLRRRKLVV